MVNGAWNTAQGRFRVWHESLSSAREDDATALSLEGLEILTDRPLATGTRVFVELGADVDARTGIDAEVSAVQASPLGVMRLRFTGLDASARSAVEELLSSLGPMGSVMEAGVVDAPPSEPDFPPPPLDLMADLDAAPESKEPTVALEAAQESAEPMADMPTPAGTHQLWDEAPADLPVLDLPPMTIPPEEVMALEVPTADPALLTAQEEDPLRMEDGWDGSPTPSPGAPAPQGLDALWQDAADGTGDGAEPAAAPDWMPPPEENVAPAPATFDLEPVPDAIEPMMDVAATPAPVAPEEAAPDWMEPAPAEATVLDLEPVSDAMEPMPMEPMMDVAATPAPVAPEEAAPDWMEPAPAEATVLDLEPVSDAMEPMPMEPMMDVSATPAPVADDVSMPQEQSAAPVGEVWFDDDGGAEIAAPEPTPLAELDDALLLSPVAEEPPAAPELTLMAPEPGAEITAPGGHRAPPLKDPFAFDPPPPSAQLEELEPMEEDSSPALPAGFSFDDDAAGPPGPSPLDDLPLPEMPEAMSQPPAQVDDEAARDPLFHAWGDPSPAQNLAPDLEAPLPELSASEPSSFEFPVDEDAVNAAALPPPAPLAVPAPLPVPEPFEIPAAPLAADFGSLADAPAAPQRWDDQPADLDMRAFTPSRGSRPAPPREEVPEIPEALDMRAFTPAHGSTPARGVPPPAPMVSAAPVAQDPRAFNPALRAAAPPPPFELRHFSEATPPAAAVPPARTPPPAPVVSAPPPLPSGLPALPPLGMPMMAPPLLSGLPDLPPLPPTPAAAFGNPASAAAFGNPASAAAFGNPSSAAPFGNPSSAAPFGNPGSAAFGNRSSVAAVFPPSSQMYDADFDASLDGEAFDSAGTTLPPATPSAASPPARTEPPALSPPAAAPRVKTPDPFAFERSVDVDFGARGEMFQQPQGFFGDPAAATDDMIGTGLDLGVPMRSKSTDPPLQAPNPMVRDPAFDTGQFKAVRNHMSPPDALPFDEGSSSSGEFELGTPAEMLMMHPENRFTQPAAPPQGKVDLDDIFANVDLTAPPPSADDPEDIPLLVGGTLLDGSTPRPQMTPAAPAARAPSSPPKGPAAAQSTAQMIDSLFDED